MTALRYIFVAVFAAVASALWAAGPVTARAALGKPDLEAIQAASVDEHSQFYYPTLMRKFLRNDTTMTNVEYQYLYYGTLFQEDYDPYRKPYRPDELEAIAPLLQKSDLTRSERQRVLDYSVQAVDDNPVNLRQINNRIYAYEKRGDVNLAKIWQNKLNHLLLVIAASGTGADHDNAWIVVSPQHEYDFINLKGLKATGQNFEQPHFDCISVEQPDKQSAAYYFNIEPMLRQYYLKHPSELQ